MKKSCHILLVVLFCAARAGAQDNGDVVVHTDPRLSVLMKKKKAITVAATRPSAHQIAYTNVPAANTVRSDSARTGSVIVARPGTVATAETGNTPAAEAPRPPRPIIYMREKEGRILYSGKGFRIQIYSGSDREKAIAIKTEVMRRYPATRTYLKYVSPTFRVKVGDYKTRAEAAGMQRELKGTYTPCVIVPDNITINSR